MSALTSSEKSPVLRWRKLKADMHSPYERRHELYLGTAYIGVVEPSADGTYLARGQNGGPPETFSTLHLATLCLQDYAQPRAEPRPPRKLPASHKNNPRHQTEK